MIKNWIRIIAILSFACYWVWLENLPVYCLKSSFCLHISDYALVGLGAMIIATSALAVWTFLKIRSRKSYINPRTIFIIEVIFWISVIVLFSPSIGRVMEFLAGDPKALDPEYFRID